MTATRRPPATGAAPQPDATTATTGQRIQRLRTARGLTQDDLAKRIAVSKSFLSEIENDHAMPGGEILLRLADALGTATDYILRGATVSGAGDTEPVSIPSELAEIADELRLSYRATIALLDARRLVLARRGRPDRKSWESEDWRKLYERLKDYLE